MKGSRMLVCKWRILWGAINIWGVYGEDGGVNAILRVWSIKEHGFIKYMYCACSTYSVLCMHSTCTHGTLICMHVLIVLCNVCMQYMTPCTVLAVHELIVLCMQYMNSLYCACSTCTHCTVLSVYIHSLYCTCSTWNHCTVHAVQHVLLVPCMQYIHSLYCACSTCTPCTVHAVHVLYMCMNVKLIMVKYPHTLPTHWLAVS